MEAVVQLLAFILPIIAFVSVVLLILVNLYIKVRRQFPVKVNCWFCNQWTKVHYDEQNCFECPTCLQYNGFNSDGDYNTPIPAQHDELLNQQASAPKSVNNYPPPSSNSNGLCHLCNNNQQLKIYQLAHFIPLNDSNYDVEIEHFQKQLEKAYKLCPPCEGVVKTTLRRQNCLLGLRFSQLRKKGLLLLDLNRSYDGISSKTKWAFLKNLVHLTLMGFASLHLVLILLRLDYSDRNLRKLSPSWLSIWLLTVKNAGLTFANNCAGVLDEAGFNVLRVYEKLDCESLVGKPVLEYTRMLLEVSLVEKTVSMLNSTWVDVTRVAPELPEVENAVILCVVGVMLQFISLLWTDKMSLGRKSLQLIMWGFLGYTNWVPMKKHLNVYINTAQIAATVLIISSMYFTKNPKPVKLRKVKYVSKRTKSSTLGEVSDSKEIGDSFTSSYDSTFESETSSKNTTFTATTLKSSTVQPVFGSTADNPLGNNHKSFSTITSTRESLDNSFITGRSCISNQTSLADITNVFNNSFINHRSPNLDLDLDIDISFNKLHLGTPWVKKSPTTSGRFIVNNEAVRPRPVISPAKLKNVTQNSWVAGGFWRDSNGILVPINNFTNNLSRSSSQTSGFASQGGIIEPNQFSSLPSSINNSLCGDFDCNSVFSEPPYYAMQGRNFNPQLVLDGKPVGGSGGRFYPILNHEQLVYVAPCGFGNVFASKTVESSPCNAFSQGLSKSSSPKFNFGAPGCVSIGTNQTYKPGSLLKDWMEKMDS